MASPRRVAAKRVMAAWLVTHCSVKLGIFSRLLYNRLRVVMDEQIFSRTMVGPPGGLDWSAPWHHILHKWNARALECAEQAGVKLWSRRCLEQHWKLASYIANLSDNRWLKRALAWNAGRRRRIGRPTNTWDAQIQMYCRWQNLGEWTAMQTDFWLPHMDSFIEFSTPK